MKKFTSGILFLFCVMVTGNISSQQTYVFSKTTNNTYTDLTGDIVVNSFHPVSGLYNIPGFQGETFEFFGLPFTFGGLKTIAMGEAPFLRIDNDSSTIIVDVAFTDIDSIDPTTRKSYLIQGAPGDRILKMQYKNIRMRYGPTVNFINVQTWYYQKTGIIEMHYGTSSANNASGYNTSSGPNIGVFYSPDNFSSCYEKLWLKGSPANLTLDSAATLTFHALSGIPPQGTIYKYTPKSSLVSPVGVKKTSKTLVFNVGPNPASDKIILNGEYKNSRVSLCDLSGKLIKEITIASEAGFEIDLQDVRSGLYLLTVTNSTGSVSKKIAVQH